MYPPLTNREVFHAGIEAAAAAAVLRRMRYRRLIGTTGFRNHLLGSHIRKVVLAVGRAVVGLVRFD